MKRFLLTFLCVCALSAVAFASDVTQYTDEDWKELYGIPEPQLEDFENSSEYSAAWHEWHTGYADFIKAATQTQQEEETPPAETAPTKPIESAGSNNGNSNPGMENNPDDKYPVGSYVDADGVVWSPDGTRLSSNAAPGGTLAAYPSEDDDPSSDGLDHQSDLPAAPDADTLALIAGLVSDMASDPPEWYVEDLRPTDTPVVVLDGLKALVTSIFGEYTPVMTTSVVSETAGNDTYQFLIETVAPGAAGVDYEWLAGVFLFGIMLFCLMKLLGGVLK